MHKERSMPAIPAPVNDPLARPPAKSTWRLIFRIVRWSTYAGAIITLLMMFHAAPAPVIVTSPDTAARVEVKILAAEQSLAGGNPATLRLDESELNSYLASHLETSPQAPAPSTGAASTHGIASAQSEAPATPDPAAGFATPSGTDAQQVEQVRSNVRDVKVQLIEDRVRAYVAFDFHGKDLTLQLEGRLSSANGYLRFEPISGQFGSLPIPQSALQSAVEKMMDSPENREKLKLPAGMSDLRKRRSGGHLPLKPPKKLWRWSAVAHLCLSRQRWAVPALAQWESCSRKASRLKSRRELQAAARSILLEV
jgi:hypothetical protein